MAVFGSGRISPLEHPNPIPTPVLTFKPFSISISWLFYFIFGLDFHFVFLVLYYESIKYIYLFVLGYGKTIHSFFFCFYVNAWFHKQKNIPTIRGIFFVSVWSSYSLLSMGTFKGNFFLIVILILDGVELFIYLLACKWIRSIIFPHFEDAESSLPKTIVVDPIFFFG